MVRDFHTKILKIENKYNKQTEQTHAKYLQIK